MNLTVNKSSTRKENESRTEIEERKTFNECVPTELLLSSDQEIIENEQVDLFVRRTPLHVLSRLLEGTIDKKTNRSNIVHSICSIINCIIILHLKMFFFASLVHLHASAYVLCWILSKEKVRGTTPSTHAQTRGLLSEQRFHTSTV